MRKFRTFLTMIGLSKSDTDEPGDRVQLAKSKSDITDYDTPTLEKPLFPNSKRRFPYRSRTQGEDICLQRRNESKKMLVLDLDNTLVYAATEFVEKKHDVAVVERPGRSQTYYVIQRPGLHRALKNLSRHYNICIFTCGDALYARKIIEVTGIYKYIFKIYDRSSCDVLGNGIMLKNVWDFGFDKEKTVIVDDYCVHMINHPENGVTIKAFMGDMMDRELLRMANFLERIAKLEDVRPVSQRLERYFQECWNEYEHNMDLIKQEDEALRNELGASIIESQCEESIRGSINSECTDIDISKLARKDSWKGGYFNKFESSQDHLEPEIENLATV